MDLKGVQEPQECDVVPGVGNVLVSEAPLDNSWTSVASRIMDGPKMNSSLDDDYSLDYVPYKNRFETYFVPIIFLTVFIIGVLGNGTLIYIFFREGSVRISSSNVLIISLAIGDFLVMIGTVPFVSIIYIVDSWPFGTFICKLSEFLKDLSVTVTAFTLTALSVERYVAVGHTRNLVSGYRNFHYRVSVFSTIGIWIISSGISVPGAWYSFVWQVPVTNNLTINVCYPFPEEMWPWYPRFMVLFKFLLLYAIPLSVISTLYALIAYNLIVSFRMQDRVAPTANELQKRSAMRARWRAAKIVMLLVAIFAFCFFPGHLFLMWFYFHPSSMMTAYNEFWHALKIVGHILTFVGSCLNPVALFFISAQFHKYIKKYLFSCWTKN